MEKIDKYLGKWASRKLIVLILAVIISCIGQMNTDLANIMMAYMFAQGTIDTVKFIKDYFKK